MLKKLGVFIIAVIVLLLIIAALLPANFHVERSIVIKAAPEKIFWEVADLENNRSWNPWAKIDPDAKNIMSAQTRGVGSSWTWDGKKVGKGTLSIIEADEFKSIRTKVEFVKPWEGIHYGFWRFESMGDSTKVTWAFEGKLEYPIERFMYFFMDKMMGDDFDKGLKNLKKKCETN